MHLSKLDIIIKYRNSVKVYNIINLTQFYGRPAFQDVTTTSKLRFKILTIYHNFSVNIYLTYPVLIYIKMFDW